MGHKLQVQTGGSAQGGTGNHGETPGYLEFLFLWFAQSRCDDCHPAKLNRQERKERKV